jgi:hypothetical protein
MPAGVSVACVDRDRGNLRAGARGTIGKALVSMDATPRERDRAIMVTRRTRYVSSRRRNTYGLVRRARDEGQASQGRARGTTVCTRRRNVADYERCVPHGLVARNRCIDDWR